MIITVTCNPAIDKTITSEGEVFDVGGKGINVSKVLKNMNTDSLAIGFIGKENKDIVYDYLDKMGIDHNFIEIEGRVRTNTKRIVDGDLEEHNEAGPSVDEQSKQKLLDLCASFSNEVVAISGSAPKNIDDDYYEKLVNVLKKNGNYVILDCDKALLKNAVKAKPDVIKPNIAELERLFECSMNKEEMVEKVKSLNIGTVCVSMGSKGATFITRDKTYTCKALDVNFVSPLGCGDSMVAAFAYSKFNDLSMEDTVRYAMAFASAQSETSGSSPACKDRIEYFKEIVDYE